MTRIITTKCPYCETGYSLEFEDEDIEHSFCPACGEQLPSYEEDVDDFLHDID